MSRPDLAATIDGVTFPDEVWAWLDMYSDVLAVTQFEARRQDATYKPRTVGEKVLVNLVRKTIDDFNAIYVLLRLEQVHQAAAHVRLCCESVITLRYLTLELEQRAQDFTDYSTIEKYRAVEALLEWEANGADPRHVATLRELFVQVESKVALMDSI